ncbi:hypothetical protein [Stenomitos frigidus]|nr:hypothetical protein [Stenomitos frigidus]
MRWLLAFGMGLAIVFIQCALPIPLGSASSGCDAAYPDVCLPSPPPDLNCKDIAFRNFRVLPPDPHHFDRDKDGIGCESRR